MILVKTDRDILLRPLLAVSGVVEKRHTLPILSNVLLRRTSSGLNMLATDLELQVSTDLPLIDVPSESAITISAKKLVDILRAIPDKTDVALETTETRVVVKAGKSKFSLQTLPADEYPMMQSSVSEEQALTLPQSQLKYLLSLVQFAMAHQDIRYYLNGLLIVVEQDHLRLIATDGHRMSYVRVPLQHNLPPQQVIVPRKTVVEIFKQLEDNDNPVSIHLGEKQISFDFSGIRVLSKLIEGAFPDYNRVIPQNNTRVFEQDRLPLLQALQRAAILSNEKFRGVRLVLTDGLLTIISNNAEQEEAQEEVEIDYNGGSLDIGFNISYLLDVLNNVKPEKIRIALGETGGSMLLTFITDIEFRHVVMPMRI